MLRKILRTDTSRATVLVRLIVGAVFLSEGIQKFLFPAIRGAGRFENIGLPYPETLGSLVATFEVLCGTMVLLGLCTRIAGIPLITIMIVALASTKIPILMEQGLWEMLHAARTDWSMLLGSVFLLIKGGGAWSMDFILMRKYKGE